MSTKKTLVGVFICIQNIYPKMNWKTPENTDQVLQRVSTQSLSTPWKELVHYKT